MAQRWGAHPSGPAGSKSPETIIHLTSPTVIPPSFILHRCFWNLACEGSQTSSQWPNPTYRYIQFDPLVFCFIFLFSMNLMPTLTIGSLHIKIPASPLKPKAVGWAHNGCKWWAGARWGLWREEALSYPDTLPPLPQTAFIIPSPHLRSFSLAPFSETDK